MPRAYVTYKDCIYSSFTFVGTSIHVACEVAFSNAKKEEQDNTH